MTMLIQYCLIYGVNMFVISLSVLFLIILIHCKGSLVLLAKKNYNNNYDLTCVSTNLTRAIAWDTPLTENFIKTESNLDQKLIDDQPGWMRLSSLKFNFGPVTDERWEDFNTYITKGEEKLNFVLLRHINVKDNFQIPISVKLKEEGHIFICSNQNGYYYSPVYMTCIYIVLGGWHGKRSVIRKCSYNQLPEIDGKSPTGSCEISLATVSKNPLNDTEWKHFSINVNNLGKNITVQNLNEDQPLLQYYDEDAESIVYSNVFVNSRAGLTGFWKLHYYELKYLPQTRIPMPFYQSTAYELCISMYIYLCKHCKLVFETYKQDFIQEVIGTDTWKRFNLQYTSNDRYVNIYVKLKGDYAVVHKITNYDCAVSEPKTRFSLIRNIPKTLINSVKCTYLDNTSENAAIDLKTNKWTDHFCNLTDHYGSMCFSCKDNNIDNCQQTLICEKVANINQCYCGAGYYGRYCGQICQSTYGYNCENKCGQCQHGCNHVNGLCYGGVCKPNYFGDYCDKVELPVIVEAPILKNEQCYTKCLFTFNPKNYKGEKMPTKYGIQHKEKYSQTWTTSYISELNIDTFSIDNLSSSKSYVCRVILYTKNNDVYQENIPETDFNTICKDPSNDEIEINSTSTAVTINLKPQNIMESCSPSKYSITINNKRNIYSFGSYISKLDPFTEFNITIADSKNNFKLMKTFQTQEDAPSVVQRLKAEIIQESSILLSWIEPKIKHGVIRNYIIKYKHTSYLACPNMNKINETIEINTTKNEITLNLLPYSKYEATVAASTVLTGEAVSTEFETPALTNLIDANAIKIRFDITSKSSQIKIIPKLTCEAITGPVLLTVNINCSNPWCSDSYNEKQMKMPFTEFYMNSLYPYSDYQLNSYFNSVHFFNESFKTRKDVPHRIRSFGVFSKSKTSISLRWEEPYPPTGELDTYTIEYYYSPTFSRKYSKPVLTTGKKCIVWKTMNCLKIENLYKGYEYTIQIKAKNKNILEYSQPVIIKATTIIERPEKPINFIANWDEYYNLTLQWQHPNNTNGNLDSFLIHIDNKKYSMKNPQLNLTYSTTIPYSLNEKQDQLTLRVATVNTEFTSYFETITIQIPPTTPTFESDPFVLVETNKTIKLFMHKEDDCDLFGKMMANKLRKLPEHERESLMYQIHGMFFNINSTNLPQYCPPHTPITYQQVTTPSDSSASHGSHIQEYEQGGFMSTRETDNSIINQALYMTFIPPKSTN